MDNKDKNALPPIKCKRKMKTDNNVMHMPIIRNRQNYTQPLSNFLRKVQLNDPIIKNSSNVRNNQQHLIHSRNCVLRVDRNKTQQSEIEKQYNKRQEIRQRKSIRELISFFKDKTQQSKNLNPNCYHGLKHRKQLHLGLDDIYNSYHSIRKHSHNSSIKKTLRKNALRAEVDRQVQIMKQHSVKSALKIFSPISYAKLKQKGDSVRKAIPIKDAMEKPIKQPRRQNKNKYKLQLSLEIPKMTAIGGWITQKQDTSYNI